VFLATSIGDLVALIAGLPLLTILDGRVLRWRANRLLALLVLASLSVTLLASVVSAPYMRGRLVTKLALACYSKSPIILSIIFLLVLPVAEETCFRGLVQYGLSKVVGRLPAWIIAASFFALMHVAPLGVLGAIIAFIQGLILGLPILMWESLPTSILLHVIANAPGVVGLALGMAHT